MWKRVLPLLLLALGCGELTSGGFGEVEVYATSGATGSGGARAGGSAAPAEAALPAEGLLAVELRVYLQQDGTGQWAEITEGVRDLTLDLRGHSERRVGVRVVSSGRYSRLRVVFSRVEAIVLGGLLLEGAPVTGALSVDLGPEGTLTVERELLVEVVPDGEPDVVLDLNAELWLAAASPVSRTVPAAAFQSALAVRVR